MLAAAVGTVSQLMIFTDPASAVSQPRPTPATADRMPNTTTKISIDIAVAATNAQAGRYPRRSRRCRVHTHTMNGRAIPAVALTAIATVISEVPRTWRPAKLSAIPAAISPTMSISLCTPPIRWMSTSGLRTQIHKRRRAVGAQVAGQPWGGPDQQGQPRQHAQPQQHRSGHHVVADGHGDELRHQDERRTVGRGGDRPDGTYVVQQDVRVGDRPDRVGIQAVAQQRALGQIRIGVPAEDGHRQQQWRQPEAGGGFHHELGHFAGQHASAQPQPGDQHEAHARPQHHRRQHQAVAKTQPGHVDRLQQRVVLPGAARAQAANGDQYRTEHAQLRRPGLRGAGERP